MAGAGGGVSAWKRHESVPCPPRGAGLRDTDEMVWMTPEQATTWAWMGQRKPEKAAEPCPRACYVLAGVGGGPDSWLSFGRCVRKKV